MDLENLGQSAAELKIAFETLQEQIKNNAQLLAQLTGDAAKGFEPSISKAKKLTDELAKANKQSLSNYKERLQFESKLQQAQKELVGLSRQRDVLTSRLSVATREERVQILALIDNYNDLIYSSQELVDNTKKLKDELQPINDNIGTKLLGTFSDLASKIPGISRFSGPFKEASEAAEKMATQNQLMFGSVNGISKAQLESLKTGRGLSAEFAKQLGLVDRNGNALRGAAAANKARTLGITAVAEKSISPLMAGVKSLGPALAKAFGPMFIMFEMLDALTKADKATGDLAKDFNLTYNGAANLREELIQVGNLSGNIALNARALQESMIAVGKSLGSNSMLNKADLETFTELREMAGYTNEELIGIQKLTLATGGNLKDNTKQFLGTVAALNAQNKLTINEKQLLKEVSNTSAAIKLSIGGTTKDLAAAAFQAKQFGINLEQADKIAESLLDFESSITNELSAELITGKDLNLERARLLALNGDIAGASAEILKQVKGSAEFTAMNRIQQEALAKAVGMSREDLAASLIEREALQKIGVKDAAAAKVKFDLLVKEKGYAAAVAELGDDQYANQLKQQSIQERFNKSVEKLQEIFISLAEPILQIVSPLMDLVTTVLPAINFLLVPITSAFQVMSGLINGNFDGLSKTQVILGGIVATLGIAYGVYKGITATMELMNLLKEKDLVLEGKGILLKIKDFAVSKATAAADLIAGAWKSFGPIPFVGAALAAAAAIAGIGYIASQTKFAKGGIVTGEINNATIGEAGPEAIIPLNSSSANKYLGGGNSAPQDNSALIEEMRTMRQDFARANNKPFIIENSMDGTKFGNAVARNTYKIQ
jgi:hypothetical protein